MRTILAIVFLVFTVPAFADEKPAPSGAAGNVEAGKKIYDKRCIFCHGDQGAGDGAASERFNPKPRDFTMGLFKYRTTPNGMLPTDDDLFRVVTHGLPGTGMPAWDDLLTEQDRRDVVSYIKTFSEKFKKQTEPLPVVVRGDAIPSSEESIEKGRALFQELECFKCHGNEGRGNGPSALTLADDKGDPILPRNLTLNWHFRGGGEASDIYMRINTGLNGTPMPSFVDSLDNEKSWHLANYVRSLSPPKRPELNVVIKSKKVAGAIPTDPADPFWQEGGEGGQEANWFPMVGQVVRHERHFTPTVRDIFVKSVFNESEIGFLVSWNDPSQSKDGEPLPKIGGAEGEDDLFGSSETGGDEAVATASDDAISLQFPSVVPVGFKKPYFVRGDDKLSVNLWNWTAGKLSESNANGIDKETAQPQENWTIQGGGGYKEGLYQVVIKRSLVTDDKVNDTQFEVGKFTSIAFQAWDGHNGETGTKMSISHWYFVLLEPETPKEVYIYPPLVILAVLGIELLIRRKLKKSNDPKQ